jgi:hypothetical protein
MLTRMICLLAGYSSSQFAGPALFPLSEVYRESRGIVVGRLRRAIRVQSIPSKPLGALVRQPTYPCRFDLQVDLQIKGNSYSMQRTLPVFMYSIDPGCAIRPARGAELGIGTAIWFLRQDRGLWRPTLDNGVSLIGIHQLSSQVIQTARALAEPSSRLSYVILSPGVLYQIRDYARVSTPLRSELITVSGWKHYLTAMRELFKNATNEFHDQLCLALSQHAICVECARDAVQHGRVSDRRGYYPYLNARDLHYFETSELSRLKVRSMQELRKTFMYLEVAEIRDILIHYACTDAPVLRSRARDLLRRVFSTDIESLPCIPCR